MGYSLSVMSMFGVVALSGVVVNDSLVMIDLRTPDDNAMSQVRRVTPEVPFPESEVARRSYVRQTPFPKATAFGNGEVFGTPWPLSEDFYLAVYDSGRTRYGIYLVDAFGNRELLYRDPLIACLDPMPLRRRTRPVEIPSPVERTYAGNLDQRNRGTGSVAIMNIYESDFQWPKDTKISAVRVIQLFPRLTHPQQNPNIGAARQTLARGVKKAELVASGEDILLVKVVYQFARIHHIGKQWSDAHVP